MRFHYDDEQQRIRPHPRAPGGLRRRHTRSVAAEHFLRTADRSIAAPSIWRNAAVTRAIRFCLGLLTPITFYEFHS